MNTTNRGLEIVPIVIDENWVFGSALSIGELKGQELLQLYGQWTYFLPDGEEQYNGLLDTQSCVSFATLNALEILKRKQFGSTENYSDRFVAVASETKPTGNNPHKVAETIRLKGMPLEEEYPFTLDLDSWEKFFTAIPSRINGLAQRFIAEFSFKHEYVNASTAQLKEALKYSPLGAAVFAWIKNDQGLYYTPPGMTQNHYVVIVGYVDQKHWLIYDSYDSYDLETKGDFIKKVDWNMPFIMVKRFALTRQVVNEGPWNKFLTLLLTIFK